MLNRCRGDRLQAIGDGRRGAAREDEDVSEHLSDTVTKIDRWADLDAEIDARYGDNGRSFNEKRVIMPRREYDALIRRAVRGDQLASGVRLIVGLAQEER